jgi:uncharacterized protein YuzE
VAGCCVNTQVVPERVVSVYFDREIKKEVMKLKVDPEADALYLRLDDSPIIDSEEVAPGVVLDYDEQNQVVGVEILGLSKRAPSLNPCEL